MMRTKHPFITLLLLTALFAIPLGLAYWLYMGRQTMGEGYTNRGDLVAPPFRLTALKLKTVNGALFNSRAKKQWMLLLFYPTACQKSCEKGLYNMRQIRTATGKNRTRIARAILTYEKTPDTQLNTLLATPFKGTLHLMAQAAWLQQQLPDRVRATYALKPGTLYLVDPIGNVMMSYKPNVDPEDVLKDLKLLLNVSQIG